MPYAMVFRKVGSVEVASKRVNTHKRPNIDGKPHLTEDAARATDISGLGPSRYHKINESS